MKSPSSKAVLFMTAADYAGKERSEGPIRAEEDLHDWKNGEESAAAAATAEAKTEAEAGCEGAQKPSGVPDICPSYGRGAPQEVCSYEAEAGVHQEAGHGIPPIHQVRASLRYVVHCFDCCAWHPPDQAILVQVRLGGWKE